ncbi:hypothetical protein AKJ16_DCAP16443 [Drosera capensis]
MFMKMRTETDSDLLALTAIVSVGYQFVFFVATYVFKFDKVSDFAGGSSKCADGDLGASPGFLSTDEWGEDRRSDQIRGKLGKLAIFWPFQVICAWTVSLPVTIVNARDHNPSVRGVDIIGWIMWLLGNLCEAAADRQKLSFKNSPRNKGMWCNVGLWKYSRHPNYFDEDSADKKFGNAYYCRQYKRVPSPLILLPSWFKTFFLFDHPLYSRNLLREKVGTNQRAEDGLAAIPVRFPQKMLISLQLVGKAFCNEFAVSHLNLQLVGKARQGIFGAIAFSGPRYDSCKIICRRRCTSALGVQDGFTGRCHAIAF